MSFTAVILGRPNVGKSTLFNRLIGKRLALVDDQPGVTRDRRIGDARIGDMAFTIVDTAGLEEAFDDSLEARMRRQTERALDDADVALMVIDARAGVTPLDRHFAGWLRQVGKPAILLANKCEGQAAEAGLYEAFELGLGEPIALSAEHNLGMADLAAALHPFERVPVDDPDAEADEVLAAPETFEEIEAIDETEEEARITAAEQARRAARRPIMMAIVGRPNVGKSTLMNALVGEERVLTGPEAGITRDAIAVDWAYGDQPVKLVDTAGMRRKSRIDDRIERISVFDTLNAIRLAQVVVLVLDADAILERQDLTIARHVVDEGRALVIAINKWDTVADHKAALRRLSDRLETSLPQVKGVPTVTLSALKGHRLDRLMQAVVDIHEVWNRRITTGRLNRWLATMLEGHPPPLVKGRRVKIRYVTQVKARPPTFALWTTRPEELPDSYMRYITNGLREAFDLRGVPMRLFLRKPKNPFA